MKQKKNRKKLENRNKSGSPVYKKQGKKLIGTKNN